VPNLSKLSIRYSGFVPEVLEVQSFQELPEVI